MKAKQIAGKGALWSVMLLAGATLQAQTVYKSVDEAGTVTFTDRPVDGQSQEAVKDLDIVATDLGQITADNAAAAEQAGYDEVADEIRETQSQEDKELQAALSDQRAAACRAANARLEKYSNARRLYRELPDGEREYLNDAELDAERADAARAVDELCS